MIEVEVVYISLTSVYRYGQSAVYAKGYIYVYGGYDNSVMVCNDLNSCSLLGIPTHLCSSHSSTHHLAIFFPLQTHTTQRLVTLGGQTSYSDDFARFSSTLMTS